tara:strand:- start:658 stop:843 length:186 start_codon:yes stop_codon:yes gene_type:complete
MADQQRELATKVHITVSNQIFSGMEVRIGEEKLMLQEDQSSTRFRLVKDENEEYKIQGGAQ